MIEISNQINCIDVEPYDNLKIPQFATGDNNNEILIWNLHSLEIEAILKGHTDSISVVKYNHKGDKLVSGSLDFSIKIWDTISYICITTIK